MTPLLVHLLLTLLWCLAAGSSEPGVVVSGLVASYALLAWLRPVEGSARYARRVPRAVGLAFYVFGELVLSTLQVAWDVVTPRDRSAPGVVAVPLDAESDFEIGLLATLVTLTPGSLSLDVSDDRRVLYVHAMFVDSPEKVALNIKQGFERRILELLR